MNTKQCVSLVNITDDNYDIISKLRVHSYQENYVGPNIDTLRIVNEGEQYKNKVAEYWTRGIACDNEIVGLIMLRFKPGSCSTKGWPKAIALRLQQTTIFIRNRSLFSRCPLESLDDCTGISTQGYRNTGNTPCNK
jgi:hypothetical protein